jgi:hypothetical protein
MASGRSGSQTSHSAGGVSSSFPTLVEFPIGLVASGFRIEKPCDLIERRQVHSRSIDPCFINGDRGRDLISFATQGGSETHRIKREHNRNIVKLISELPEARPSG